MPGNNRGLALVIVLFILAMMMLVVTWLADEILLSIHRTENLRDSDQAWQMAVGSEQGGTAVLARDLAATETDHLNEGWNNLGAGVSVEEGTLATRIIDLQSRFNLNNLAEEIEATATATGEQPSVLPWTAAFRRLRTVLDIDPGRTAAVLDWLDADQSVRGSYGAEDSDYLGLDIPYRAANRRFSDVSELLWVKGFDEGIVAKLAPFVTVLPESRIGININTATPSLLRILAASPLSEGEVVSLVDTRPSETGFSVDQFLDHPLMAGEQDVVSSLITDRSEYFAVLSTAEYGRARIVLDSVVQRTAQATQVIQRRRRY